jgi:competence protein ComEA
MTIFESQIKGLIAICIALAIITFISFFFSSFASYKFPVFTDQSDNSLAIEIVDGDKRGEIYFVSPQTTANQLLKTAGSGQTEENDFPLESGMRIKINSASGTQGVIVEKMNAAKRLALGMQLDINKATEDDLLLITGIGEVTAKKILDFRRKLGRFRNIEQLMKIEGIKEKRLAKFRKYLNVEKQK